jgi:hypothetical protein
LDAAAPPAAAPPTAAAAEVAAGPAAAADEEPALISLEDLSELVEAGAALAVRLERLSEAQRLQVLAHECCAGCPGAHPLRCACTHAHERRNRQHPRPQPACRFVFLHTHTHMHTRRARAQTGRSEWTRCAQTWTRGSCPAQPSCATCCCRLRPRAQHSGTWTTCRCLTTAVCGRACVRAC